MTLSTQVVAWVRPTQTNPLDLGTGTFSPDLAKTDFLLTNGTGANQADRLWADTRTINASSNEDLDLAGSLTDAFGATITLARVKLIYVKAAAGNTNNVVVGGAASNGLLNWVADATDKINVRPGGVLLLAAPDATAYAVTAATGDLLRIANSGAGTSVTYDIVIVGSSA